jgi:hypothetical protein
VPEDVDRGDPEHAVDRLHQPGDVGAEALVPQHERVAMRQTTQALGQLPTAWHYGAVDQDRDHPDVALQGHFDFQADDVVGVVQPAVAIGVDGVCQWGPITASSTSEVLTACVTALAKSMPRSYNRPAM